MDRRTVPERGPSFSGRLAELSEGEELFALLFDQAPVAYSLVDPSRHEVLVNQAFLDLFGYERDDAARLHIDDLTHPDGRQADLAYLDGLLDGSTDAVVVEKRYVRSDGSEFWGQLSASALRDDAGRVYALLGAITDITERVQAREALADGEARFRSIVQASSDAVLLLDAASNVVYASPSAEGLFGFVAADLVGTSALALVYPDEVEVVTQSFLNTSATPGPAVPLRFRVVGADGLQHPVEAVATNLLDDRSVGGIVVNLRDLTTREEAVTALEVSENRFRRMLENISDTVTLLGASGEVLDSTGQVKEILGYPTGSWDVRNIFELGHPDDVDRGRRLFVQLLDQPGGQMSGEFRVRHADGSWATVELTAVNLLDDPDVAAVVLTSRNITDRKRTEEELAAARDQALRALQQKSEFVASVSHELRTPIHGILGMSELLSSSDLDEEARGLAESISRATEALRMVLDDILDFSKIEAGKLELVEVPTALPELLTDVAALLGPQAEQKGIEIRLDLGEGFPERVFADGLRLRQVVTNLVGNAVKFTDEGGVSIEARSAVNVDGTVQLRFAVHDTGIGISPEEFDRLFEPFSQARSTTAQRFGGTGLGLTIARRLVELMGGELRVESEPGIGSTFSFVLPRVAVAGEAPEVAAEVPEPDPVVARFRVLVVEDNPVNQMLVVRQLERLGYEPTVVDSGVQALERWPSLAVDVVLMDWQMPELDGLETTRRLREVEREGSRVPIIATTASALPGDRARCLEAGMDDFLAKPVSLGTLGAVLTRWLLAPSPPVAEVHGASVPSPEAGPLDAMVLARLGEELDDPDLVATVLRTYLRELPGRLAAIEGSVASGARAELKAAAHTLKSTSATVGALVLAETCRRLEAAAAVEAEPAVLPTDWVERHEGVARALGAYLERLG